MYACESLGPKTFILKIQQKKRKCHFVFVDMVSGQVEAMKKCTGRSLMKFI